MTVIRPTNEKCFKTITPLIGAIGAYLAAPSLILPLVWLFESMSFFHGVSFDAHLFAFSRLIACAAVIVMWKVLARLSGKGIRSWLRLGLGWIFGSLLIFVLCAAALFAICPDSGLEPYYLNTKQAVLMRLIAMPVNIITINLGFILDAGKSGVIELKPAFASDVSNIVAHYAFTILGSLIIIFCYRRIIGWWGQRMKMEGFAVSDKDYKALLLGWTATIFLPFYIGFVPATFSGESVFSVSDVLSMAWRICVGVATTCLATPLFFRVVKVSAKIVSM